MDCTEGLEKSADGVDNITLLADNPADVGVGDFEIDHTGLNVNL